MRGPRIPKSTKHHLTATGAIGFPPIKDLFDLLTLQPILRPTQIAGNDGEVPSARVLRDVLLGAVGERADHHVTAVIAQELRRHGLHLPRMEEIEEERLDDVVAMMPERDPGWGRRFR